MTNDRNKIQVGLWKKSMKNGEGFYSGKLLVQDLKSLGQLNGSQKITVSIFKNKKRQTERHPHLNLCLYVNEETKTDDMKDDLGF